MELALDAIELALPTRHCRLNIDSHILVGAPDDPGGIDLRSRWGGVLRGACGQPTTRGIRLRCIDRHVARRLRGLCTRAAYSDDETKERSTRNSPNGEDHVATSKGKKSSVRPVTTHHGHIKAEPT
jgi:hypothetical protein